MNNKNGKKLMNQNLGFGVRWYVVLIVLLLCFIGYSLMYPVKYGVDYFLSYSDDKVDARLTSEFAKKLSGAGIVEITNGRSIIKSQSKITFFMDYVKFSKEDTYHKAPLKNAWVTFDGEKVRFVGELKLNYFKTSTQYDEYDAAYLSGKEAIKAALDHIEGIKHHVTRDLIKISKQKNEWDNAPQT